MKKNIFIPIFVIFLILAVITGFAGFCFWLFSGEPSSIAGLDFSSSELSFLMSNGFLESKNANADISYLKSLDLIEQNLNSENESFKVLATKLNKDNYQLAFELENKSEQDKDFYLIPVSKESQLQFKEIKGIINDKNTISISKEDTSKEPLEQLYDVEKHKKELNPKLAKAYEDIKKNGYSAKPIKITLPPKSILLARSGWQASGSLTSAKLKPVYFLVYGSAGGAKDDLVILNIHSSPQQGQNWEVLFTTNGNSDLRIIPNDQATVNDDEFVSLSCNNEERTPQILKGDVIYYPNWECFGIGKVVHYTKKSGKHILRFEFNGQIAFAYNTSWLSGWSYRKKITIDNAYVDADLTDFPVYIKISADADIGDYSQADGDDIRFTSSDGTTLLDYEEETWSGGAGTDATADYWVKVPTVATAADTDIYIYYGNANAFDGQDAINTWDTNFEGVWHLKEDPSGSAPQMLDSTTNNNDGTSAGTMLTEDQVTGKVDGSLDLDGADDRVSAGDINDVDGATLLTVSAWVKVDDLTDDGMIVSKGQLAGSPTNCSFILWRDETGSASGRKDMFAVFITDADSTTRLESNADSSLDNNWHHIAFTYTGGSASGLRLYIDSVEVNDSPVDTTAIPSLANTIYSVIIGRPTTTVGKELDGGVDEVRLSTSARLAEWTKFEYNNIASADNEISFLNQERCSFFNQGWLYRKKITIDHTYVDSNLTNFPLYVYLDPTGAGSGLGSKIMDNGYDIRFTSSDGLTTLSYERESYSEASGNSTGYFWVNVPTVAGASNTDIYMYYGKSDATDGQDVVNTWDTNFKGVWHLGETATDEGTTADLYQDSTINSNDGDQGGPVNIAGKVYNGQDFETDDYIGVPYNISLYQTTMSVSFWARSDTTDYAGNTYVVSMWDWNNTNRVWTIRILSTTDKWNVFTSSNGGDISVGQQDTSQSVTLSWAHLVFVTSDGGDTWIPYYDGVALSTLTTPLAYSNQGSIFTIGGLTDGYSFDGAIDDVRLSSTARSAAWIKFEYYNINEADNELAWESEETPPPAVLKVRGNLHVKGGLKVKTCGSFVDARDGKTYTTILIGSQCWMRENLNVGTLTAGVNTQGTDCPSASAIEKYCYDDSEANCTTYGGLYQWNQAMCGSTTAGATGICPTGWHIPTHDELTTLERAVCTSTTCVTDFPYDIVTTGARGTDEGITLKTVNSSSFSGLLTGIRDPDTSFYYLTTSTFFWSSVQSDASNAWTRSLDSGLDNVPRNAGGKTSGFSVRCLKD